MNNEQKLMEENARLRQQLREQQQRVEALKEMNEAGRGLATQMSYQAKRKSTFANYEVEKYAKAFTQKLTQVPLKKTAPTGKPAAAINTRKVKVTKALPPAPKKR